MSSHRIGLITGCYPPCQYKIYAVSDRFTRDDDEIMIQKNEIWFEIILSSSQTTIRQETLAIPSTYFLLEFIGGLGLVILFVTLLLPSFSTQQKHWENLFDAIKSEQMQFQLSKTNIWVSPVINSISSTTRNSFSSLISHYTILNMFNKKNIVVWQYFGGLRIMDCQFGHKTSRSQIIVTHRSTQYTRALSTCYFTTPYYRLILNTHYQDQNFH